MGMTIDELKCIIGEYKLRIPPTVYYELLADLEDAEFIPKADYENRLKADFAAMLDEIDLELAEQQADFIGADDLSESYGVQVSRNVIREKINALKGEE